MPQVGESVGLEMLFSEGAIELTAQRSNRGLIIDKRQDGSSDLGDGTTSPDEPDAVVVDGTGDKPYEEVTGESSASGSPDACSDTLNDVNDFKEYDTFHWRYNRAGVSNRWKGTRYDLTDIRRGSRNMTTGNNNCSFAENTFWSKAAYEGSTSRDANVTNGGCGSNDGYNVVAWGYQDSLARACWWAPGGDLKSADIEISNRSGITWFSVKPDNCSNAYDLESVMTHEWGHVFGMAHVSEEKHGNLTMSTQTPSCKTSPRTLGNGDWAGMDWMYGT
jgi:hypothetical protein